MKFDKDKMAKLLADLEAIPPFDSLGHCLSEKRFKDKLILAQVSMPYGKYKDKNSGVYLSNILTRLSLLGIPIRCWPDRRRNFYICV